MDRKTIVAVALCLLFLVLYKPLLERFGLGGYLTPARSTAVVDTTAWRSADTTRLTTPASTGIAPARRSSGFAATDAVLSTNVKPAAQMERSYTIETPYYHATFTNRGARLISVEMLRYASAHGVSAGQALRKLKRGDVVPPGDRVVLAGGPLMAMDLGSRDQLHSLADAVYAVEESLDASGNVRALTFQYQDSSGMRVRQVWRSRPADYALDLEVQVASVPAPWRLSDYSFTMRSWPLLTESDLDGDLRGLRATSLVGTNIHREGAGGLMKGPKVFEGNAVWAVVQNRYFMNGLVATEGSSRAVVSSGERRLLTTDEIKRLPPGTKNQQEVAINSLVMALPSNEHPSHRFTVYVGPCEYFRLSALHHQLERAVDMGWAWVLPFSKLLLQLLNWLFGLFKNYGVAIIALATVVRLVLHPLNMVSMKSMRAMQRLQPEMDRIKEKYKKDPTAMNAAVMALYKEHKVNPAGGCLPMVLQMPLFLALYQVLLYAIELRQAPFMGWIHDLSAPDLLFTVSGFPLRLLPVLMAGSGFLSQLVTPTSPQQAPTMYMMNAIMLVFFYNLPSGLVLYWTVMNLLTALQQWLVLRQDTPRTGSQAVEVVEPEPGKKRRGTGSRR